MDRTYTGHHDGVVPEAAGPPKKIKEKIKTFQALTEILSEANCGHDHCQSWSAFLLAGNQVVHYGRARRILARKPSVVPSPRS